MDDTEINILIDLFDDRNSLAKLDIDLLPSSLRKEESLTALERTIRLDDRWGFNRVIAKVLSCEDASLTILLKRLTDKRGRVRAGVAYTLGLLNAPEAVGPLMKALNDEESDVRWTAVTSLGNLQDKRAIEPILIALDDHATDVRDSAITALAQLAGREAVLPIIGKLKDSHEHVRMAASRTLRQIGEPAVGPLLEFFQTEADKAALFWAVEALTEIRDKRAIGPFLLALQDKTNPVRSSVARALGIWSEKQAVEPLINLLRSANHFERSAAAEALGRIGDKRAIEPLIKLTKDKSWDTRSYSVEALGKIGDERAIEPIISALADNSSRIRADAAVALGKIGDTRALEALSYMEQYDTAEVTWHSWDTHLNGIKISTFATQAIELIKQRSAE